MSYFLVGVLILAIGTFLVKQFAAANVATLARNIRWIAAGTLLFIALLLAIMGRWVFSFPLLALAFGILRRQLPGFGGFPGQRKSPGQTSTVRSAHLEMHLNHDSGDMDGEILAGALTGRMLSSLSLGDLLDFVTEISDDEESVTLMDAYLDRRFPGWRDEADTEDAPGARRGPMTSDEAFAILGLTGDASEAQIRSAHRKLMKKLHPDQGGSTYFATKLNEARDLLLP